MNTNLAIPIYNMDAQTRSMKSICQPLETMGIDHLSVIKSHDSGEFAQISTLEGWIKDYYKEGLYTSSEFEDRPQKYKKGVYATSDIIPARVVSHAQKEYNSYRCFTVVIRYQHHTGFYFFSVTRSNQRQQDDFYEKLGKLYQFIDYFNEKSKKIFLEISTNRSEIYGEKYINSEYTECEFKKKKSLTSVNYNTNFPKITGKEEQCLKYFLAGISIKKIASRLYISTRTVEFHLNNIKAKFSCRTGVSLISKLYCDHYEQVLSLLADVR